VLTESKTPLSTDGLTNTPGHQCTGMDNLTLICHRGHEAKSGKLLKGKMECDGTKGEWVNAEEEVEKVTSLAFWMDISIVAALVVAILASKARQNYFDDKATQLVGDQAGGYQDNPKIKLKPMKEEVARTPKRQVKSTLTEKLRQLGEIISQIDTIGDELDEEKCTLDSFGYCGTKNEASERHGIGSIKNSETGEYYIGMWKHNQMHGVGKTMATNGDVYVGEWKFSNQHGLGQLMTAEGDFFEGEWKSGSQNGVGVYKWKSSGTSGASSYEGEWLDGNPHGQGTWQNRDSIYTGAWKDGKRHGKGKVVRKKDKTVIFEGMFYNDKSDQQQ